MKYRSCQSNKAELLGSEFRWTRFLLSPTRCHQFTIDKDTPGMALKVDTRASERLREIGITKSEESVSRYIKESKTMEHKMD